MQATVDFDPQVNDGKPVYLMLDGHAFAHTALECSGKGLCDVAFQLVGMDHAKHAASLLSTDVVLRRHPGHRLLTTVEPSPYGYEAGASMPMTLRIKNIGGTPCTFLVGGRNRGDRDNQFSFAAIHEESQRAVPDTGSALHFGGPMGVETLKPGETFEQAVNLSKWFVFKPGLITLHAQYQLRFIDPEDRRWITRWEDQASATIHFPVRKKGEPPPFAAGQVWTYKTREGEEKSRVVIGRVETQMGTTGTVVHCLLRGLSIKAPEGAKPIKSMTHIPVAAKALVKSVIALEGREAVPDVLEGYDTWRKAYDAGQGGIFGDPLAEIVAYVEKAMAKK